jgi:CRP/FNR family transcriptional regulator, anaerobic regulatory protein
MTDFLKYFSQLSPLDSEATNELLKDLKTITFQKGEYLLKSGEVCKHLFFINEGLTKVCFNKADKEFIMRFFQENIMFSVFDSFLSQSASNSAIIALENTRVTIISYDTLMALCKKYHCVETFLRKLISIATIKMTKRISEMLEENASEAYSQFIIENSILLQRISLGDVAKYLGITQQSLSRIRTHK